MACDVSVKPVVLFDECDPFLAQSVFDKLYMGAPGEPFADAAALADPTVWAGRIDNADTTLDTTIRELWVQGSKAAVATTSVDLDNGRTVQTDPTHVYTMVINETNQENYEFARTIQASGAVTAPFWLTDNKSLYGGLAGFTASISASHTVTGTRSDVQQITLTLTYKGALVERIATPFAA